MTLGVARRSERRGADRLLSLLTSLVAAGVVTVVSSSAAENQAAASATPVVVAGRVRTAEGAPLAGAAVAFGEQRVGSDAVGGWSLSAVPGLGELVVSCEGYVTLRRELRVESGLGSIEVTLHRVLHLREDVVVQAVRAEERTPVTKTDIAREDLESANRGQEMPYLLATAPSVNFQSDSGIAAGYSYFNVRGVTQTRLNITLDGVPLQDPEDQALYFANFGDFGSVVDSVQIQRGIGTSSYGSASYGGSVNFASVDPGSEPALEAQLVGGSWGTARGSLALHSGDLGGGVALYGRFSAQTTDGFRERSGVEQRTFYFGATRQDERSLFKLFGFVGRERTQLAYLATEEAVLRDDLRHNDLTPEETDDFGQDVVHLQYTRLVGSANTLKAQAYYNGSQGWFRIRDFTSGDPQEFAIDGHFVGLILGATHVAGPVELKWGAHANDFSRDHTMDLVGGARQYLNTGLKNESSSFLQASWNASPRTQLWADAQVRHARFEYRGDQDLGSVSWTFFNPKAGVRFDVSPSVGLYASLGRMSREPARMDMLEGEDDASLPYDLRAIAPEKVLDLEAGVDIRRERLSLRANLYAMEFRDEIALSGELSEIGLPARRNVPRSARRGLELELDWRARRDLRLSGSASLSRNRIEEWTQFYDVYDETGTWIDSGSRIHEDVPPLLSPQAIVRGAATWTPREELMLEAAGRWVAAAQLDNTGDPDFRTPLHFSLDGQLTWSLAGLVGRGEPRLRVQGVNLLDSASVWPSGYSYLYVLRGADGRDHLAGTSYYYPQATRSLYLALDVRF